MTEPIMFIGRWSPFHDGHKYIIDAALKSGHQVVIAVRDTNLSKDDPYPAWLRVRMIQNVYLGAEVRVISIPDISQVCVGRDVGYLISEIPQAIEEVSGTKIRRGESQAVPSQVQTLLHLWEKLGRPDIEPIQGGYPKCIWLYGLAGAGKSIIGKCIHNRLAIKGIHVATVDGDDLREGVSKGLGYSMLDRTENIRRAAFVCKGFVRAGVTVVASFMTPLAVHREMVKQILGDKVKMVLIDTPIELCRERKLMLYTIPEALIPGVNQPFDRFVDDDEIIFSNSSTLLNAIERVDDLIGWVEL